MVPRLFLILVTVFFVTMNLLLWRFEISGRGKLGGAVPTEMVWQKVVTAPDSSALEIRHLGKRVGYCRWSPSIQEGTMPGRLPTEEMPPEGMVQRISGYRVDFDGGIFIDGAGHVRFNCHLELSTNQVWQKLHVRLNFKPTLYEVEADAADEIVKLHVVEGEQRTERNFKFADFRNPEQLLGLLGGPGLAELLRATGLALPAAPGALAGPDARALGLRWEARQDWLTMGRIRLQIYRIEGRLFDRFEVAFLVSRVGEILRVELPGETLMVNDAFMHL